MSQSLESIDKTGSAEVTREDLLRGVNPKQTGVDQEARNVLMPCGNGQSYSVSQNQIVHLPGPDAPSVKHRVSKLETQGQRRRGLVLNLTNQFEAAGSKPSSPESDTENASKPMPPNNLSAANERLLENGESSSSVNCSATARDRQQQQQQQQQRDQERVRIDDSDCLVWTASAEAKLTNTSSSDRTLNFDAGSATSECVTSEITPSASTTVSSSVGVGRSIGRRGKREGDPFSAQLDRVFDREERREPSRESPSRQSSWSSYDSAVVLDNNSVHSSWATLPSRNSSWGSYDMRPSDPLGSSGLFPYDKEEIPWHPGTVKRTKQKLEESNSTGTVKRVCTQGSETETEKPNSRLATVASDEATVETYNPVLLHYTQSPTPRRRDSSPIGDERIGAGAKSTETSGLESSSPVGGIDISPVTVTRQLGRLSTSAPAPSALSPDTDSIPSVLLRTCRSESETSSPCVVNTTQCTSVKHHKMVLENLSNKSSFNKRCMSVDDSPPEQNSSSSSASSTSSDGPRNVSGIVKNLKKEFEAKSTKFEKSPENSEQTDGQWTKRDSKIIRSLPSSPVIAHSESKIRASPSAVVGTRDTSGSKSNSEDEHTIVNRQDNPEDLSVRVLVGKYEVAIPDNRRNSEIQLRSHKDRDKESTTMEAHPPARSKIAPQEFARRSAPIMINHPGAPIFMSETPEAPGRPPVPSPSVVVASVVAKAASKKQQQHGRTHPLARLQVRPRHSSPVYNTM